MLHFRDFGVFVFNLGCFVFDFWVLRFRDLGVFVFEFWVLCFWVLGALFSRFGCFVFEIWVLRASVFVFECFVFETTPCSLMLLLFNMLSLFSETLQTFRTSHFERSESSNARSSSEESERNNDVGISTYTRNSQVWVIHYIPQTCDLLVEMSPESSGNFSKMKSKLSAETHHHLANHQLRWQAMACYSQSDCGLEGFL